MGKIVAIGGGEIKDKDTLPIDKQILELTGKQSPKLLFLPTASGDAEGYWSTIQDIFGSELGAQTDVLMLTKETYSAAEIEEKILSADAIYVGGGNTQKMLNVWNEHNVHIFLREAFNNGVVMSGLSAGAICWFEYGSTDSPRFSDPNDLEYVLIEGLGFTKGLLSPHHIREPRRIEKLPQLVKQVDSVGFGLDDNVAIEVIDDKYRIIASKPDVGITKVFYDESGTLHQERLYPSSEFEIYSELVK